MKIVVIGGNGLIGSKLVTDLRERGHETAAASPDAGVNTLAGASVVVDVSNAASDRSTRNLLAAEAAAGVEHHVALSVTGTENDYVEELIKQSSIPYSIVRATRCSDDVAGALARISVGPPLNGVLELSPSGT
jgi:uncharacterized protein YbjT (DUF2867 family)